MRLRAQQPLRIQTPNRLRLGAREFNEVRRACMPEGQRPSKRGMEPNAGWHVRSALVANAGSHGKGRSFDREVDIQFEVERIYLEARLVRRQPERRGSCARLDVVEQLAARKAMSR